MVHHHIQDLSMHFVSIRNSAVPRPCEIKEKSRHNLRTRILSTETSDATFLNCHGLWLERLLCVVAHYTPAIGSCKHVFKGYDVVKLHAYDHCFVCTSLNQETLNLATLSIHYMRSLIGNSSWSANHDYMTIMFLQ